MTCKDKLRELYPDYESLIDHIVAVDCPEDHMNIEEPKYCDPFAYECKKCWDREFPYQSNSEFNEEPLTSEEKETLANMQPDNVEIDFLAKTMHIKDSGDRTQFETGAVRDMREGKGRCDLMPLEVVAKFMCDDNDTTKPDLVAGSIALFKNSGYQNTIHLYNALLYFSEYYYRGHADMFLEVAKHFEEGAKKYGENNWQKGIPVHCYIDSAVRHYLKFRRGDIDEPHNRAFVWNLMCCIWEVDYREEEKE
jgi:hypothetical protein